MLKSITLKNYKCFKDETTIDIAPLTVLCGVNSSGKSSILKSLLMLKQSYDDNPTKGEILFAGKDVDNGTFRDVVFNNHGDIFTLSTTFQIGKHQHNKSNYHVDIADYRELSKLYEGVLIKQPTSFSIAIELSVKGNTKPQTPFEALKNTIVVYNITISCHDLNMCIGKSQLCMIYNRGKYDIQLTNFPLNNNLFAKKITEKIEKCSCYFDGLKVLKIYSDNAPVNYNMSDFLPNIYVLFDVVANQFYNIKHMSPLREDPSRRYVISQRLNEVDPSGENFAHVLAQFGDSRKDFTFIKTCDDKHIFQKENLSLLEAVRRWSVYLEVGKININQKDEILKVAIDNHNLLDVGFGVSQCLPILVSGLFEQMDSTIIFEQPEIHLHPKVQMNMADYLLSLSFSEKNVIVETHSDHIINRIVRRCMESEEVRNKVKIYFIDKDENGMSKKETIVIDPIHGAMCENENFFYQFASETEKIIDIGYRNLQRKREGI